MSSANPQLGDTGEQEAQARLQRALQGHGAKLSGFADKGLDLLFQFESPRPDKQPLHFGVQVKTGNSFASLEKGRWHIKNLPAARFHQWTRSKLPVLFVWIRPTEPIAECYWGLIRRDTQRESFSISARASISPVLRYDLTLESARTDEQGKDVRGNLLVPPLNTPLRIYAKTFYKQELMSRQLQNPVVGQVAFTWRGWRHITGQRRPPRYIYQSLQFLSIAADCVSEASRFLGIRRMLQKTRGAWTTEVRLLIFEGPEVHFKIRPTARPIIVLREQIRYPAQWINDVHFAAKVVRHITFESIYEKVGAP